MLLLLLMMMMMDMIETGERQVFVDHFPFQIASLLSSVLSFFSSFLLSSFHRTVLLGWLVGCHHCTYIHRLTYNI